MKHNNSLGKPGENLHVSIDPHPPKAPKLSDPVRGLFVDVDLRILLVKRSSMRVSGCNSHNRKVSTEQGAITSNGHDHSHENIQHLLGGSHVAVGGRRAWPEVVVGHHSCMGLLGGMAPDGMGHHIHHGGVEDNHQWGHEGVGGIFRSDRDLHSSHDGGICPGILVGCNRVVVHGDHSRRLEGMVDGLET
jgi:hypothetical protein